MSVISHTLKNSIAAIFVKRAPRASASPRMLSRIECKKRRRAAYLAMWIMLSALSAGIMLVGMHSIILSFQIYKLRQMSEKLSLANERLRVLALDQIQPEILASEAAVLQLTNGGKVRYLTIEPQILAGSIKGTLAQ